MIVTGKWRGLGLVDATNWKRWMHVCVAMLGTVVLLVSPTPAQTTPHRITQTSGGMATIAGTVHPLTRRAIDLGAVNSQMQLQSLTLNVSLSAAQQTDLDSLLEAQQSPQSPQYHQWLTQQEYGARFGLDQADLNAVTAWLTGQGFTVRSVSKARNAIHFSGKVSQVEAAFHTQLHRFQMDGREHFANTTDIQVPAGLGGVVLNVRGLNSFRLKPHLRKRAVPSYTVDTTQGLSNFLTPADWAKIYDVNPIYAAGYTGMGAHVGVVGQTYAPLSDITNFRSAAGMTPPPLVTYACIDPVVVNCTGAAAISTFGDLDEADLDIEWAGGIAKDATVDYVYAPYSDTAGVFDALQYAVEEYTYKVAGTDTVLPVISMSYTDCEASFVGQPSYVAWVTAIGQHANSQGQTLVVSSGDSGAFGCDSGNDYPASLGVSVGVPVDSPFYTGVGGTTLTGDESSPATYWNQASTLPGSAISYIPETVWNDTAANFAAWYPGLSASSGGVSLYYPQPIWQPTPTNYTGAAGRFVPDVAFAASPNHDGYMICSSGNDSPTTGNDCTNGFWSSGSSNLVYLDVIGGTSAGAPSFAGMLTLLVEKYGPLGNINPMLYNLATTATYSTVFHAAQFSGIYGTDSDVPCLVAFTDLGCPDSPASALYGNLYPVFGYSVGSSFPYYNLVTGLGSIDGGQLFTALGTALVTPLPTTTTTVIASPASLLQGGAVTITAVVSSGATPTGFVTFSVGGVVVGDGSLVNGVATWNGLATPTSGFISGTDAITASYSGSTTYAASQGSASVTVLAIPTTTSVTVGPTSIALGSTTATQSITATVTASSGTPSGTVSFQVGGVVLASSVALTQVPLTTNGSATLSGIAPTTANGFTTGTDTVTVVYSPALPYMASTGTAPLTVTAPAYTITPSPASISLNPGGSQAVTVALASTTFADTVRWTATTSSPLIMVSPASGTVTLPANGSGSVTLQITASGSAANHAPALPWTSGLMAFGAVLASVPLARRRKRAAAVLLTALAISTLWFTLSCGGGSGSASPTPASRQYTVTVKGSGNISSVINVTVR